MEEKPTSTALLEPTAEPDENLGHEEGLRIAGQALGREIVHYGGQGAIAMAIIGAIVYAGFWSLKELRYLPAFVSSVSRPFSPPPVPVEPQPIKAVAEKPAVRLPVRKHHPRPHSMQIAAKAPKRQQYSSQGDPHGGHIIYSDGMITQYSWDK